VNRSRHYTIKYINVRPTAGGQPALSTARNQTTDK